MTRALAVLAGILAVLLTACGVGPEAVPRAFPSEAAAVTAPEPAATESRAGALVELWFVDDDKLVPTNRTTEDQLTDQDKIDSLEEGPTAPEVAEGLRTALTPVVTDEHLVTLAETDGVPVPVAPDQIAVVLNPEFSNLPSQEQLLILGQVVLTLTAAPDISVVFVDQDGTPVGVPLPSGRLTSEPVTATDYASLIAN